MGKICELFIGFLFVYVTTVECQQTAIPDLTVKAISRAIDISSQLCKVSLKIQIDNTGKSAVSYFVFSLEEDLKPKVAFISAHSSDKSRLKISDIKVASKSNDGFWKIVLKEQLQPGKSSSLEIDYVLTDALTPYPTMISQKEKQLVRYNGNHYVYLPYTVLKQYSTLSLGTKNIENYSKLNPVSSSDTIITYGPYNQIPAYSFDPMVVHYENNAPFVKVTKLQRTLEVSHWGNVAVEEIVDLLHTGAKLKGPFSRYDFQREAHSGLSSVKSFKTILPASATDVYYRDDIGNISTSHMKVLGDAVELDLRPRFPLFGGWKTHYVLGYNVPSYEYLYNSGDLYKLKMRVLDHIYDDMVVEELTTKVILPEGAEEILLTTPYPMTRLPDMRHSTYLDTKGRPVITIAKRNLVENHIQPFELDYVFPKSLMLQEPLLVAIFFYLLFLLVIIYVRLDFSICKDEAGEVKLRVSGSLDKLLQNLDNRANTYNQLDEQLAKVKASKDVTTFNINAKAIQSEYKYETVQINELATKLKPDSPDIYNKVQEIQKLDKSLKDLYNQKQNLCTEKRITGKVGREAFLEAEAALNKKKDELIEKINAIVKTIH